jgi:hypothetical protein
MRAFCLLLVFLSSAQLYAQLAPSSSLNATSSKIAVTQDLPNAPSAHFVQHGPALPHPEVPTPRVVDRAYWIWMLAATGSTVVDIVSTQRCLEQGRTETNLFYGSHPSSARLYVESAAIMCAYAFVTYHLKRQKRGKEPSWAWQIVPGLVTGSHAVGAAVNSGCW